MARFEPKRVPFGQPPETQEDDLQGLPSPARVRAAARRQLCLEKAAGIVSDLPHAGESLHALTTSRMDLTDVIQAILDKLGTCDAVRIATLGYNARNLHTILSWLDAGQVLKLTLLASNFFRAHNAGLWAETQNELKARGHRCACANSHAKVVTMTMQSGHYFTIEGSANLCGNGSGREQFALINNVDLMYWHATWIAEMVEKNHASTA